MTTFKKISRGLLALVLMITVLFGMNINAEATYRAVWMQTIYKDNGVVTVLFKIDVSSQYYTDANVGYIIVKDADTGITTEYRAKKIASENGEDTYLVTYRPADGQRTLIKICALIPSITGHQQLHYDENGGHWYQD